mmetsp:Transcript_109524/g.320576  ORF Transcript_109524/g.320576 Transcript_109524/m.320576 type:complete len:100 (-) Transcript_109524:251-550(-)
MVGKVRLSTMVVLGSKVEAVSGTTALLILGGESGENDLTDTAVGTGRGLMTCWPRTVASRAGISTSVWLPIGEKGPCALGGGVSMVRDLVGGEKWLCTY